jgi:hypothetical protein
MTAVDFAILAVVLAALGLWAGAALRRAGSIERRKVRCPETGSVETVRVLECARTGRAIGLVECTRLTKEGLPLCDAACIRSAPTAGTRRGS